MSKWPTNQSHTQNTLSECGAPTYGEQHHHCDDILLRPFFLPIVNIIFMVREEFLGILMFMLLPILQSDGEGVFW